MSPSGSAFRSLKWNRHDPESGIDVFQNPVDQPISPFPVHEGDTVRVVCDPASAALARHQRQRPGHVLAGQQEECLKRGINFNAA